MSNPQRTDRPEAITTRLRGLYPEFNDGESVTAIDRCGEFGFELADFADLREYGKCGNPLGFLQVLAEEVSHLRPGFHDGD